MLLTNYAKCCLKNLRLIEINFLYCLINGLTVHKREGKIVHNFKSISPSDTLKAENA